MGMDERYSRETNKQYVDLDLGTGESLPVGGESLPVGQLGSLDDSPNNLPGSQTDPEMPNSKVDPEAPISSAKGTAERHRNRATPHD